MHDQPANANVHMFAAIEFDWRPVDAARAYTGSDLLTDWWATNDRPYRRRGRG